MKICNFIQHPIPKIKIQTKRTSLINKKRGTQPKPIHRVRDSSGILRLGKMRTENESEDHRGGDSIEIVEKYLCEQVSRRYSGKPDPDKIVEARNYFCRGTPKKNTFQNNNST